MDHEQLKAIYRRRFEPDLAFRRELWTILCRDFFQRFVPTQCSVLELGAGHCEFINRIVASRRVAVDRNPDIARFASEEVETLVGSSTDLGALATNSIDVVFASNFFEHLTREEIAASLCELTRVLGKGGRLLVLQPNYRYCYRDYFMFFDHITPLDHRSLAEALETNGLKVIRSIPRFLPYTTKSRLPKSSMLIRAYLRFPLAWRFFGKQCFLVGQVMTDLDSESR